MLVLCGLPVSNYYSKVKLALLEKGVPFEEERIGAAGVGAKSAEALRDSPLGKIPFIRTESGPLCESQAILEYIEAAWPEPPLLPKDPYAAAKVRELIAFIDLHVELVARELYPKAFFGGSIDDQAASRVKKRLERNIAALERLVRFEPYIAGATFTQADCAAWASFGVISMATQAIYGEDLLAAGGIDWKPYAKRLAERPSVQKVVADRKAAAQDRAQG
ncbi:MAG: glutathione S-transferase family protein [Caldimonas sp.]